VAKEDMAEKIKKPLDKELEVDKQRPHSKKVSMIKEDVKRHQEGK